MCANCRTQISQLLVDSVAAAKLNYRRRWITATLIACWAAVVEPNVVTAVVMNVSTDVWRFAAAFVHGGGAPPSFRV